jgi:hypothetical protein
VRQAIEGKILARIEDIEIFTGVEAKFYPKARTHTHKRTHKHTPTNTNKHNGEKEIRGRA